MTDTLVERLALFTESYDGFPESALIAEGYEDTHLTVGDFRALLATLKAQASRIAELDEALLDIQNRILCPVGPSPTLDEIAEIASKALSHSSETPDAAV